MSYININFHVVFSTKYRLPWINRDLRKPITGIMSEIIREDGGLLLEGGGIEDHMHLLFRLPQTASLPLVLQRLKASTSRWVHKQAGFAGRCRWLKGYAAFSVGYPAVPIVRRYIQRQEIHHRHLNLVEEYKNLLRVHGIEFDENRLFEDD